MATLSEDVEVTCGAAPVQIEGRLTDGRTFYFRSRHQHAKLGVGADQDEAVDATLEKPEGRYVERDLSHLGPYGASCIGLDEAFHLLREMAGELS